MPAGLANAAPPPPPPPKLTMADIVHYHSDPAPYTPANSMARPLPVQSGMPVDITRERVQQLAAEGAQLVEVLAPEEYNREHLPGAINLPLAQLTREAASRKLSGSRPIVVYCQDSE